MSAESLLLGFVILFAAMLAPPLLGRSDLIGKGRVLSRPLWRFPLFRPIRLGSYVRAHHVRYLQLLILALVAFAVGTHFEYAAWVYDFGGAACYVDDLVTGDDDRWNGLRRRIKRAIAARPRLRVRTPVPSPA